MTDYGYVQKTLSVGGVIFLTPQVVDRFVDLLPIQHKRHQIFPTSCRRISSEKLPHSSAGLTSRQLDRFVPTCESYHALMFDSSFIEDQRIIQKAIIWNVEVNLWVYNDRSGYLWRTGTLICFGLVRRFYLIMDAEDECSIEVDVAAIVKFQDWFDIIDLDRREISGQHRNISSSNLDQYEIWMWPLQIWLYDYGAIRYATKCKWPLTFLDAQLQEWTRGRASWNIETLRSRLLWIMIVYFALRGVAQTAQILNT